MTTKQQGPIWVKAMQNGWYGPTPATHRFITEGEKFQIKSMDDFSDFDRNETFKDGKGVEHKKPPGWMRRVVEPREIEKAEDGKGVNPEPTAPSEGAPVITSEPEAPAEIPAPVDEVRVPAASGRGVQRPARRRRPGQEQ